MGFLKEWMEVAGPIVLGGVATFFFFMRRMMSRQEHRDVCKVNSEQWAQKLETLEAKLQGEINVVKSEQKSQGKLLEKMDGKLDQLIRNGGKRP